MRQCQRETTRSYDYGRNRDNAYYGDRYSNDGRYWDGYRWRYRLSSSGSGEAQASPRSPRDNH